MVDVLLVDYNGFKKILQVGYPPPPEIRVPIREPLRVTDPAEFDINAPETVKVKVFKREYTGELPIVYREV